jgi:hypothetical protein
MLSHTVAGPAQPKMLCLLTSSTTCITKGVFRKAVLGHTLLIPTLCHHCRYSLAAAVLYSPPLCFPRPPLILASRAGC